LYYIGIPIIWALIGLIVGTAIGLLADYCMKKVNRKHTTKKHIVDGLLFVKCDVEKFKMVEEILSKHYSLGMAKITNE